LTELATAGVTPLTLASADYLAGIAFKKSASPVTVQTPYFYFVDAGAGPLATCWWKDADLGTGASPPSSTEVAPDDSTSPLLLQQWTLTAPSYIFADLGEDIYAGVAADVPLPSSASDYWIFLRDVVVANGESLTVVLNNQVTGAETAQQTLVIDMGAADKVTFGAADVALNASTRWTGTCTGVYADPNTNIELSAEVAEEWWSTQGRYIQIADTGTFLINGYTDADTIRVSGDATCVAKAFSISEESDTFDVGINIRPTTTKADVFWINKTTGQGSQSSNASTYRLKDIVTRGHKASAGTRNATAYTCTLPPAWLSISGTATIDKIQVGLKPLVLLGDSQLGTKAGTADPATTTRLGAALPTAFTFDRLAWNNSISGGALSADGTGICEAMWRKFVNDTPGQGDLCEMSGIVLVMPLGVNDIALAVGNPGTDLERNHVIGEMSWRAGQILHYLYQGAASGGTGDGRHAIIVGLPQWPGGNANEQAAVANWNAVLWGMAVGCRASYFAPYSLGAGVIDVDDLHYSTAGATTVAAKVAARYESGRTQTAAGGTQWIEW